MRFARRIRQDVEVNLTPLIDVVFLLLIFFMVSTTFTKETHLSIDLPEASAQSSRAADLQIEISITKNGDYAINGVALVNSKQGTLTNAIEKISEGDNAIPMIITADSATPHQSVVTALDVAGQLGFTQLSITTQLTNPAD
ncbi:MAG: biopolymer transporter ExbD [Pseudomonadales bacterium]|nr:biopolymer transporter ExbD [Pseudomonadales bacterium]MBO6595389.1 biopolymer transporter ExbD [Pseudomonadales bacterium]MBO6657785.1 biopolymer transporter ExbD [Pseudomonadales bacterium]MBO6701890.1 biopolymer transporter ExbD [Pseudomonadales bacterium]MBO6821052.1 biopolymer transporter ExbD [Pseudomonadales bacterium]